LACKVSPPATSAAVMAVMKANTRSNTKPELRLRSKLHGMGLRFRKDFLIRCEGRRCRPDIVFTKKKLAVFVDGCFWHHCPIHGRIPVTNAAYWAEKILRNIERDKIDSKLLEEAGWTVLRFWEHEDVVLIAEQIRNFISNRKRGKPPSPTSQGHI